MAYVPNVQKFTILIVTNALVIAYDKSLMLVVGYGMWRHNFMQNIKKYAFRADTFCAVVTACLVLLGAAGAQAAEITIREFLTTAKNDFRLTAQDEKTDFLKQSSSNTPLFEKIEFRTESNNYDASRQQYRLRAYPNGWGKTRADRNEYDATLALSRLRRDVLFHEALKKRYMLVVEFLHARSSLESSRKLRDVYADVCMVMKKYAGTTEVDLKNLVSARETYDKQQLSVLELESTLRRIEYEISRFITQGDTPAFDPASLPGIDQIGTGITDLQQMPDGDNIYVREQSTHVDIARSRYEQKKAESSKIISFLGTSYDGGRKNSERDSVAFEMGIMLPFINSNRLAVNRGKIELLDEKERQEELKLWLAEQRAVLCRELADLLEQYRVASSEENEDDVAIARIQASGADPLVLLRMREHVLKKRLRSTALRGEIYLKYIDLLDVTGTLSAKPLKNYLSAAGEHIDL